MPATDFAVYVMNLETFAVSSYANYPFNSFAEFNGMYLGCGADGLFQLDTDIADVAGLVVTLMSLS